MTDNSTLELNNPQALTHMLETMRKGQLEVKHNGNQVSIDRKLGTGGSKTVYDAVIDNAHYALAVPNTVDGVERMVQKWKVALQEPANTNKVKTFGLHTIPDLEAFPVDLNGVPFTALKMTRYQDLPYPVMDGKNPLSSTVSSNVLPENVDASTFEEFMDTVMPDIKVLIENGIRIGRDSISICLIYGRPRLFLTDLGDMKVEPIPQESVEQYATNYVVNAYSSVLQGLTEPEYQQHRTFFNGEAFSFKNPNNMTQKLTKRVMNRK